MNIKIVLIAGLLLFGLIGCGWSELMVSKIPGSKIVVDGNHEDWTGKLKYFENERVAVGFQNDEDYLYFCLVTADKANARKIMALGLTIWFQPSGDEETIGLLYPLRMDNVSPKNLLGMNRNKNVNSDFELTVNRMMQNQGEFELVNDDDEILYSAALGSNDGFKIKVGVVNQQFIYEAKVPIGNNELAQIPINVFPNEKISIQFETGEIDMEEMKQNGNMRSPGMGQGGGGMQGGGGRGAMQSGSHSGKSRMGLERFKLDVDVKLAK